MKDWLLLFVGSSAARGTASVAHGTAADIATHLQRLLDAPEGSALIIEIAGVEEDAFVQLTAGPESIQFDQPLLTARQVGRELALRETFTTAGLMPYESRGSDGSRFLDCDLPRDSLAAAMAVARVLQSVFGVGPLAALRFVGWYCAHGQHGRAPMKLETLSPEENARIWAEEAQRRSEALDSGALSSRTADEVLRDARARL